MIAQHTTYSIDDLRRTVEVMLILDSPHADPAQLEAARRWNAGIFPNLPVKLRQQAIATVRAMREQRFVGMV